MKLIIGLLRWQVAEVTFVSESSLDEMMKWQVDYMMGWWNGKLVKWQVDEIVCWWNGWLMKWPRGNVSPAYNNLKKIFLWDFFQCFFYLLPVSLFQNGFSLPS
jgi:hypothetical protein